MMERHEGSKLRSAIIYPKLEGSARQNLFFFVAETFQEVLKFIILGLFFSKICLRRISFWQLGYL